MEGLKFLFLAFLIVFLSIKLSIYADIMDKRTKLGGFIIGGLLLASITSFPELVTSMSAIFIRNPALAIGDIFGSNVFNVLIISSLDIVFIRHMFMKKISHKYIYLIGFLILIHVLIILAFSDKAVNSDNMSIVSVAIFFIYIVFVVVLSRMNIDAPNTGKGVNSIKTVNKFFLKFAITAIGIIVLSIALTIQANKIVYLNPIFSASTVGAFLLGITTSLPEVVSIYSLVRIRNYNLAFSNVVGSNAFNFFVFALCDVFVRGGNLYSFKDSDAISFLILGLVMHTILLVSIFRQKERSKLIYIVPSVVISLLYFYIFYLQFS